jgi:hypothetical protein
MSGYVKTKDMRDLRVRLRGEVKTNGGTIFDEGTEATVARVERVTAARYVLHLETDDGRTVRLWRKKVAIMRPQPTSERKQGDER